MFRDAKVWDFAVMTRGTTVKLEGYSPMNDKYFKGLEYKVLKIDGLRMDVQAKNGQKFTIETWEIGDDPDTDLTIEIIDQIPYEMPF